jgi:hypothetical protein
MRVLLKASWDTAAGNALVQAGKLGTTVESILNDLQPEVAYFLAEKGKRTAHLILNMEDASQLPAMAEPFFLATGAEIEVTPVMFAEDLQEAAPAIEAAAKKYG